MASTQLDHLVVAARTLDEGAAWCESTLGVTPGPGGRHALFGTHNRLLRLDAASGRYAQSYLEIIAIDPEAPAPGRPRWFALDSAAMQARLAQGPRLVHAVLRSNNVEMHRWGLITVGQHVGDIVSASRATPQGLLQWRITLRSDGELLLRGALPTLIEWQGPHPADSMAPSGVHLQALQLAGLDERTRRVLQTPDIGHRAEVAAPALRATLCTPLGEVVLSSGA